MRLLGYALGKGRILEEIARDLESPRPIPREPTGWPDPGRPLRLFVSCGEASSEAHAVRVVEETNALLQEAGAPPADWSGLGGEALAAAGVRTLADPTDKAVMGGQGVASQLGFWRGVLASAASGFEGRDAVVMVDAPALHLPMARIATRAGIPTLHHVAPQYWAWAPWRVAAYRKAITRALCILPFEPSWFARHGVAAEYVGHPQLDILASHPTPPPPLDPERKAIALLPGSRAKEIEHVLPAMLSALDQAQTGDAPVLVLQRDARHAGRIRPLLAGTKATLVIGDPHDQLQRVRAALATSGTVLFDLLHHRIPAVALYALNGRIRSRLTSWLVTVPHFAGPNLLAGQEVLPEVAFPVQSPPDPSHLGQLLSRCYNDPAWRGACIGGLDRAAERLGPPGAARRAAGHLLELACSP